MSMSMLTIIATGMTFLFIAGELDLSVGTMYGLLAMIFSRCDVRLGVAADSGDARHHCGRRGLGAFNGVITTFFRVPSFIVTLGMISVFVGLQLVWIRTPPSGGNPSS